MKYRYEKVTFEELATNLKGDDQFDFFVKKMNEIGAQGGRVVQYVPFTRPSQIQTSQGGAIPYVGVLFIVEYEQRSTPSL